MDRQPLQKLSREIASKIELIESLIEQKKFKEALAEIRELESQKQIDQFSIEKGYVYYLLSVALHYLGRYHEALKEGKRAFELLKTTTDNKRIAQLQFTLGAIYVALGNFEHAESELRDVIATYRRIDDKRGIITAYNKLANICFVKSNFDKAIEYINRCLKYCDESGDETTKAKLAANLGRISILIGKWQPAQESLLLAVKVFEEKSDELYLCQALLSLGYVCCLQRDFRKAKKYYEDALKLIYENNYMREMAIYYEYYGELAFAQGNYFLAKDHCKNGIKIGEEIAPDSGIVSQTYRLLAESQIAEREYDEALSSCEKALKVAESLGEKIEMGAIHRALGQIYTAKGAGVVGELARHKLTKAKEHFEKSISILEQIGAKFELGKAYLEAVRSNAFEYFDGIAYYANGREIFKELGSDYHVGKIALAFCEFLFENGEYNKAEVYLREPEKIFKRLSARSIGNEKKDLDLVLELKSRIDKALGKVGSLEDRPRAEYYFSDIITQNPQMLALLEEAKKFKDLDLPILLEGETGTGKDLLAKVIHCESKRKNKRFVKVNCAAIPETLLESELFGYKRGAFTGADRDKKGLFEEADGGTIFLNEIRDLPVRLQAKILDVIEDKEVTRLGDVKPKKSDFRVIASTNKNLAEEVEKGNFREDLYHRLKAIELKLPPLRERKQDIPLLIKHFLAELRVKESCWKDLDKSAYLQGCLSCNWPGNVRQLQNELKRLVSILNPFDSQKLLEELSKLDKRKSKAKLANSLSDKKAELEKGEILEALKKFNNREQTAKFLGISKITLYRKIKMYNLEREFNFEK
ncbi:MAG: sigma 54-interacting transcriptional regulator [Candidatus Heimdallarchaeota archaeon]